MVIDSPYAPIFESLRGDITESLHYGAVAVVDRHGNLYASWGDPMVVTYLRSSAKPFQALPLIEAGGVDHFGFTSAEVALMCSSHSGTDDHAKVAASIQEKAEVGELDLMCGIHPPMHQPTADKLRERGDLPTPNRHNCSGKHSGMLAYAKLMGWPVEHYIDPIHPVQQKIFKTFAELCSYPMEDIELGIDGCSAPNFGLPLKHAAIGYARLCDPEGLSVERTNACNLIVKSMTENPEMVGGPDRFDTVLMNIAGDRLVAKGGAEGYQAIGVMPGVLGRGTPALGIALKISDGDPKNRARPSVALEVLRQLGVLFEADLQALSQYGPELASLNHRNLNVGIARPCLDLVIHKAFTPIAE